MTIRIPAREATLLVDDETYPLAMTDGQLTADEGWAPQFQASVAIANPGLSVAAKLDPTNPTTRIRLTLRADTKAKTRTVDLKLIARQREANGAIIGLSLASDEQLMQDFGLPSRTPDSTYWANQSSVRSIVFNVLNRVLGAGNFTLAYAAPDAPFPTFSRVENIVPNGGFDNNTVAPWVGNRVALAGSTTWTAAGTYSMALTPNGANNDSYADLTLEAQPGSTYTVAATGRNQAPQSSPHSRARTLWVYALVDGQVIELGTSAAIPNTTGGTARVYLTFTVPVNATEVHLRAYNGVPQVSNGVVWWDSIICTEGNGYDTNNVSRIGFFDGATTDSATYFYDWSGDAYNSSSTRTPILDRTPDALTWTPGQSAWDFLTPILQALGWRLTAESVNRAWTLRALDAVDGAAGVVHLDAGLNLYSLTDLVSRTASQADGTPLFADAVLIHYTWTDSVTAEQHERWDYAGPSSPSKTYSVERPDTAYPGPGAATYVLGRIAARRQQLTIEAAEDYTLTTGREVSVSSPLGGTSTGYIDAITWDFTTARMNVRTKAVIDTPRGSIGRAPSDQNIGSVTADLASYTN